MLNTDLTEAQREQFSIRLLTLANLLNTLTRKQYDHNHWVKTFSPKDNLCNTSACAFGWAACDKKLFPDMPVKPVNFGDKDNPRWELRVDNGTDNGSYCSEGVQAHNYFGPDTYYSIFSGSAFNNIDRVTPGQVAKRIVKFVRDEYGYEYV